MKWRDVVVSVDGVPIDAEAVAVDFGHASAMPAAFDESARTTQRDVDYFMRQLRPGAIRARRRRQRGRERREAMRLLRLMHQGGPRMRREGFAAPKARRMVRRILAES